MTRIIKLCYWNGTVNAGVAFSGFILDSMGLPFKLSNHPNIVITGSILGDSRFKNAYIWGLGFGNATEAQPRNNVLACRGKLTQQLLNVDCVLGDPGILASYFYTPSVNKKYKFGIIPHYVDFEWFSANRIAKIIDIRTSNFAQLFSEINECEFIISSSLHGIIFALSYGIPAFHVQHTELASKKSFKFNDFFSATSMPHRIANVETVDQLKAINYDYLYSHRADYVISSTEIQQMQNNLLSVFPYKWKKR